jgi:hypothetical protein
MVALILCLYENLLEASCDVLCSCDFLFSFFWGRNQKSHGDQLAHPWLLVTIGADSGGWMDPLKKEEIEREIR